jgi:sugar/nucleoside kinase (ribokinase family)
MRYASAAAALATTRKGARTSMPYRADVTQLLNEHPAHHP